MIMNDYYSFDFDEYELVLKQIRRDVEIARIVTESRLAKQSRKIEKENFKTNTENSSKTTKNNIEAIKDQLDTAIKGEVRNKLETLLSEKLNNYDSII
ncbi:hypothetical protein [Streptococcus sp. CSL10205-OR2]|uniref:hypothetical protein n=1 Tax=Streptococcus sp. CSL10205-OR2 TaxID=2980558 RepID=UPI0021DADFF6|nr:hypothetical protein [Streptococcus sp. CSL10205-OR2]MCU9533545.1 hypothetical protein [Streptococcus sp. CSL10205-OR2]